MSDDNTNDAQSALRAARSDLQCAILDLEDAKKQTHVANRKQFIQSARGYVSQALIQLAYAEAAK